MLKEATIKKALFLALAQITVIVVGVSAGRTIIDGLPGMNYDREHMPVAVVMLEKYCPIFLAIPFFWFGFVWFACNRHEVSAKSRKVIFWSGALILIALLVFVLYADTSPLIVRMGGMDGDSSRE